jgi:monoterpene epsilon-lactone hydrolase
MGAVASTFRILLKVVAALVQRWWRRLWHGPAVPGWSWSVELRAVAMRAFVAAAATDPEPEARRQLESRFDPPLPRRLRRVIGVEESSLAGLTVEWHRPRRGGIRLHSKATILYLHGGAYVSGSAATHRRWVANLTWGTGTTSVVPNYRLAPQHRFPAALDDAVAVYRELLKAGVEAEQLFVSGDSAGGGLAAALLLRLRDDGVALPAGGILFSPYTDLEHTAASIQENAATDYLPLGAIRVNTEYLGDHDPRDPYASPLYGDFSGLPPLLVFAGGREMIRDDSTRLVAAAARDGIEVDLEIAPDMYHVWTALLPNHPETMRAIACAAEFIAANTAEAGYRRDEVS